jgi:hypothetical protein
MLLKDMDYIKLINEDLDITSINETNITYILGLSNDNYETIKVTTIDGKLYIVVRGKNMWKGLVAYGSNTGAFAFSNALGGASSQVSFLPSTCCGCGL